jgi:secreted trypsin-like serine protease
MKFSRVSRWLSVIALFVVTTWVAPQKSDAVVGGGAAAPGEIPWQASILENGQIRCNGALIAPNWVLTASHCVYNIDIDTGAKKGFTNFGAIAVRLGSYNLDAPDGNEQTIAAAQVVPYSGFSTGDEEFGIKCAAYCWRNDLALIKLATPAQETARVKPIKILTPEDQALAFAGNYGISSGWGVNAITPVAPKQFPMGGPWPRTLQKVSLPIVTAAASGFALCDGTTICAKAPNAGICFGDSGAPFAVSDHKGGYRLAGIVSYYVGNTCGSASVFSRVTTFANWISSVTGLQFASPTATPAPTVATTATSVAVTSTAAPTQSAAQPTATAQPKPSATATIASQTVVNAATATPVAKAIPAQCALTYKNRTYSLADLSMMAAEYEKCGGLVVIK